MQWFVAHNWPVRLWLGIAPLAAPVAVCWYTRPLPWVLGHWLNTLAFAGLLVVAWVAGWFFAILGGWLILGPVYYAQGLWNGAPYREGEYVRLLVGSHRGCVKRVYEVWDERHQVRVELGEGERARYADVFSYVEVCREPASPRL